jgi:nitrogen regulatory protein P-II 1
LKLIEAIADPESVPRIQEALERVEVFRLTLSDVTALAAREAGAPGQTWASRPAVRLEIAVNESFVKPTLDALFGALREAGDEQATICVLPLRDVIRIRTGEHGTEAI